MERTIRALKRWNKKDIMDLHHLLVKLEVLSGGQVKDHITPKDIPTAPLPYWASLRGVWGMDEQDRVLVESGKDKWKVIHKDELPSPPKLILESSKGEGDDVPFSFRLTSRMKELISIAAEERGQSGAAWVRETIAERLIREGYVDE